MEITKKVRKLLIESDLTATQLAVKIGTSQSNLSQKMKSESYSVSDLIKIAEASDAELEINFTLKDGTKI